MRWDTEGKLLRNLAIGFVLVGLPACIGGGGGGVASRSSSSAGSTVPSIGIRPPSGLTRLPRALAPRNRPQAGGSNRAGIQVSGAGTTRYVYVLNTRAQTVVYQGGTWLEPYDGGYQRMIISRSTSVPPGRVVQVPTACMQQEKGVPASGGRFFSQEKRISGALQICQARCLSGGSSSIQTCVWGCQSSSNQGGGTAVFNITDDCNDGYNIEFRFFQFAPSSRTVEGQWPAGGGVYFTTRLGVSYQKRLSCTAGRLVCYGARRRNSNSRSYWGVGIDGDQQGGSVCVTCPSSGDARFSGGRLVCN